MLVDREYVGNAVGLNSVAFNAPAVIGPALAGLLIVWVGVAGAFYFNAAATLAVVAAVMMMRPSPPSATRGEPTLHAMRSWHSSFIVRHPALRWIVLAYFVTAILTRPYSQLIPAYAVNVLHAGARGLGWAVSAIGIGGFGGALVTAYFAAARAALEALAAIGTAHVGRRFRAGVRADARRRVAGALCRRRRYACAAGATNTLIQTLSLTTCAAARSQFTR